MHVYQWNISMHLSSCEPASKSDKHAKTINIPEYDGRGADRFVFLLGSVYLTDLIE
jgi:hypothetical protein